MRAVKQCGLGAIVFAAVLGSSWWLIRYAATDIPWYDQWDVEGHWLYPRAIEGTLEWHELTRAHNEHRILWTNVLNLALFKGNGHWDPLLQLAVAALLRAGVAAALSVILARGRGPWMRAAISATIALAFLPIAAWHNLLWGFQTQVLFAVGFGLGALAWLTLPGPTWKTATVGLLAGGAGMLAMAPVALVPVAIIGVVAIRWIEERRVRPRQLVPAVVLLVAALALRRGATGDESLLASTWMEFVVALGRALAWPHTGQPLAAVPMVLPLILMIGRRLATKRQVVAGEDFVIACGFWAAAIVAASAWVRGGGAEWTAGVPSRYADFLVLLPIANIWCAVQLVLEATRRWRGRARTAAIGWTAFLAIGWTGLTAETLRNIILPRVRDRDVPVRLMRQFQLTGDAAVFVGQPRLLIPHPDIRSVNAVLHDPRMAGVLPPSLQPECRIGPLSRVVRALLRR